MLESWGGGTQEGIELSLCISYLKGICRSPSSREGLSSVGNASSDFNNNAVSQDRNSKEHLVTQVIKNHDASSSKRSCVLKKEHQCCLMMT